MLKILIIIDDLRAGGTENVLASRIYELKSEAIFTIITLFALGPVAEKLKALGVNIECLEMKTIGLGKSYQKVKDIIQNEQFDSAVCMRDVTRALFPNFLKQHIANVAILWDSPRIRRSLKYFPFEWLQVKFSRATPYCSSRNIAQQLKKTYGLQNVTIIPNCYNQNKFKKRENFSYTKEGICRIITVGGTRKEKNYPEKLAIAELLKNRGFKFQLTIVGYDPDEVLQQEIQAMNLENEVQAVGESDDIPQLLAESDLFLMTSTTEGFPVALLEAMVVGLPCVAYEFSSLCEIDKDFANLAVVPQGAREDAAEKIIHLSTHLEDSAKLAEKASKHISANFAADKNSKKWLKIVT